jgi:hypothetical protein
VLAPAALGLNVFPVIPVPEVKKEEPVEAAKVEEASVGKHVRDEKPEPKTKGREKKRRR